MTGVDEAGNGRRGDPADRGWRLRARYRAGSVPGPANRVTIGGGPGEPGRARAWLAPVVPVGPQSAGRPARPPSRWRRLAFLGVLCSPAGQPAGAGARGEIFANGLREPFRNGFERASGKLWIGNRGQGAPEEVDFLAGNRAGGQNVGGRIRQEDMATPDTSDTDAGDPTAPVLSCGRSAGAAVTGGCAVREAGSALFGQYVFGDFISGCACLTHAGWACRVHTRTRRAGRTREGRSREQGLPRDRRPTTTPRRTPMATRTSARTNSRAATGARNDILAQLKDDHRRVKKAYRQFQALDADADPDACAGIVQQVLAELSVHAALEEELLYPAARNAIADEGLIDEAEVEHETLHTLIDQLRGMSPGDEKYSARFTVLCEYVVHHVKEEEGEMFPALERVKLDWEGLAAEMSERRQELTPAADEPAEAEGVADSLADNPAAAITAVEARPAARGKSPDRASSSRRSDGNA